ncbi:hypothetical protein [Spirosoma harenae]
MNSRWRLWLLHVLTLCIFISATEVNTREIVNACGDYCEAYLPIKFVANSVQSATVSAERSIEQSRQAKPLIKQVCYRALLLYKASNRAIFGRSRRIYLRCCQWLN